MPQERVAYNSGLSASARGRGKLINNRPACRLGFEHLDAKNTKNAKDASSEKKAPQTLFEQHDVEVHQEPEPMTR